MKDEIAVNIEISEAVDEIEDGIVDKALQIVKEPDMSSSVVFSGLIVE